MMARPGLKRSQWRRSRSRGAVIAETALIIPLVMLLLVATTEFGMTWRADNQGARAIRASLLEEARAGSSRTVDFDAIDRLRTTVAGNTEIDWMIVYRTAAGTPEAPAACVAIANALVSGSGGITGTCTVYSGAYIQTADVADFTLPDCLNEPDEWLCPQDRAALFGTNDRIGVVAQFDHQWLVGMLPGDGVTATDFAVSPLLTSIEDAG